MTEPADKYDDLAKTAGAATGLKPEQIPGFAHILRELARSERAEQKEACARVAEERSDRCRDYAATLDNDALKQRELVASAEGKAIAAAIRAME